MSKASYGNLTRIRSWYKSGWLVGRLIAVSDNWIVNVVRNSACVEASADGNVSLISPTRSPTVLDDEGVRGKADSYKRVVCWVKLAGTVFKTIVYSWVL